MYENAEKQIAAIIALAERCPAALQEKCFEVLLEGYVNSLEQDGETERNTHKGSKGSSDGPKTPPDSGAGAEIPIEIKGRFTATAKRLSVPIDKLSALFDFNSDPFTYHALHVPGTSKAEKTRNVALLVGVKNYLTNGQWTADWKEVRAQCVDQNCYDRTNMGTYLKHEHIKSANAEAGVVLSPAGVKAAEALLAGLAAAEE